MSHSSILYPPSFFCPRLFRATSTLVLTIIAVIALWTGLPLFHPLLKPSVAQAQQSGQVAAPAAQVQIAPAAQAAQPEVFGPAPTPESGQPSFLGSLMELLPVLVVCYFIFYFMVVKPQDSSAKAHKTLIESLKKGDEVITSGGMIGKIAGTDQGFVTLEIASGVKVKFEPNAVKKRMGDEPKSSKAA